MPNKKILGDQGSSDAHPVEANESDALVKNCYEGIADVPWRWELFRLLLMKPLIQVMLFLQLM